jgi:hypothetical protein
MNALEKKYELTLEFTEGSGVIVIKNYNWVGD